MYWNIFKTTRTLITKTMFGVATIEIDENLNTKHCPFERDTQSCLCNLFLSEIVSRFNKQHKPLYYREKYNNVSKNVHIDTDFEPECTGFTVYTAPVHTELNILYHLQSGVIFTPRSVRD